MVPFDPVRIPGRWREGYALDLHTVQSTFLGDDEYGRARFDTKRSAVGELLYRLKYKSDLTAARELVEAAVFFVRSWAPPVDLLVPVPASRARAVQPLLVVGEPLARELKLKFSPSSVRRIGERPELKDVYEYDERFRLLSGLHQADRAIVSGRKVLLFDDLFRSGATMNAITAALFDQGGASEVYALTLTRTRSHR
ncbi:MAG: ComF family protein [Vicinamibacteria bacterium]